jgi:hypothetical protein
MVGNPDVVGSVRAFNWTTVESILAGSASRNNHAVLRFYVVFPGRDLEVPKYLIDAGVEIRTYTKNDYINEPAPYFGDALLQRALKQFVNNFGAKYDGNKRIAFIQAGLLGFWGEWHSMGLGLIPEELEIEAVKWYASSFSKTNIQFRFPNDAVREYGFGVHDDSFAYQTLDGLDNGGEFKSFYSWPRVVKQNMTGFWRKSAFGGETRNEIAGEVFEPTYPAGTFQRQDFMRCVETCHATYMFHQGTRLS